MHVCNTHVRFGPNRLGWGNGVASQVGRNPNPTSRIHIEKLVRTVFLPERCRHL